MHEHQIRLKASDDRCHSLQDSGSEIWKRLRVAHDIQIGVRTQFKKLENLIEHLSVLRSNHDLYADASKLTQRMNDWRHLDGLGPCPEDHHHILSHVGSGLWVRSISSAQPNAASNSGSTLNRSPTRPMSAISKMAESASLLIATIVPASLMPVRCWIAPEMPTAM